MAKQTFTTGQVLTAAQMTSLQQTAMGGGAATAKTASYVLVAADAGTTVAMNAAGATTITVNIGLFAAGDTVFIQNLGAGACTVTAGTATVATAGSLILPQNDAGILYFTSASAAIFYDYIQAGAVSPLTTKGDLYTFSTSDARLGVGANGTTLVADSSEATGLKWAAPAGGASFVGVSLYITSSTTIPNNTFTTLTYASEEFDTDGFHDNSTNTDRITIPAGKAGKYLITAKIDIDPTTGSSRRDLYIVRKNSSNTAIEDKFMRTASITDTYICCLQSTVFDAAVGDYFITSIYQNSGGNMTIENKMFQATYLGA